MAVEPYIDRIPVWRLMLVKEGEQEAGSVKNPADAAEVLDKFLAGRDREHFVIIMLDTRNLVTGIHTVSIGTLNGALIHPREVFKAAILANCEAVILGHNHPSGDPSPSPEDIAVTKRLVECGEILGIKVLDHVITGYGRHVSLKTMGLDGIGPIISDLPARPPTASWPQSRRVPSPQAGTRRTRGCCKSGWRTPG